jgi:hypothetical protein
MAWLPLVTALVNLIGLLVSLWLGLYLATRSAHSRISWMGALTVWAVGTWFLHNALQGGVTTRTWTDLLGQGMKLSVPFWFHLTCLLRFASAPPRPTVRRLTYLFVAVSFGLVVFQILESAGAFGAPVPTPTDAFALRFSDRWVTASFPLFLGLLIVLPIFGVYNLVQGWRQTDHPLMRRQLRYLVLATAVAYIGGVYAALGAQLRIGLPVFPADAILGLSVVILGYAVAGYSALLEGRSLGRDALYSATGLLTVVAVYSLVTLWLYHDDQITLQAAVAILVIAVITHALLDGGRTVLDRLFYAAHARRLRTGLRALAAEANLTEPLPERLGRVLDSVRHALQVKEGFIAVRQDTTLSVQAAAPAAWRTQAWTLADAEALGLTGDDISVPSAPALRGLALLVPLCTDETPVGVLALGPKASGFPFRLEDLTHAETVGEQLALMIQAAHAQTARAQKLDQLVDELRAADRESQRQLQELLAERVPAPTPLADHPLAERLDDEAKLVPLVEDALRHLHDYSYLGRHPLSELRVIQHHLPAKDLGGQTLLTHVDRGKALHALLVQTIAALQPGDGTSAPPGRHDIAPREWHAYLILHGSYVADESVNDIMARLYIGEGTYNRTRRSGVRSVAQSLHELEQAHLVAPAPRT